MPNAPERGTFCRVMKAQKDHRVRAKYPNESTALLGAFRRVSEGVRDFGLFGTMGRESTQSGARKHATAFFERGLRTNLRCDVLMEPIEAGLMKQLQRLGVEGGKNG